MFKFSKIAIATMLLTASLLASCAREPVVTKDIESPFFGSKTSKVQLTVYSDFQCPGCIYFHQAVMEKLKNEYITTNKIGYTFIHMPLTSIHDNAFDDATASMCAAAQGKFPEFADKMYALE